MTSRPSASAKCIVCNVRGSLTCGACKDAIYCSPECQRTDWKAHKLICSLIKDCESPPSDEHRRALHFKANEKNPKFAWVQCAKGLYGGTCEIPVDLEKHIGAPASQFQIFKNRVRYRTLEDIVLLLYDDNFRNTDQPLNRSIAAIISGERRWYGLPLEETIYPFAGDFVCIVQNGHDEEDDFLTYRHFKSGDMRNVVDHLTLYKRVQIGFDIASRAYARKVKGVRVHCKGAGDIQYTATSYPQDHPFPKMGFAPRFLTHKLIYYESPPIKSVKSDTSISNITTTTFAIAKVINPKTQRTSKQVDYHVVRQDGKQLLPQHVEAMCLFLVKARNEFEEDMLRENGEPVSLDQRITSAAWRTFWEDFKATRGLGVKLEDPGN